MVSSENTSSVVAPPTTDVVEKDAVTTETSGKSRYTELRRDVIQESSVSPGEGEEEVDLHPKAGNQVKVHYCGYLAHTGTEEDVTTKEKFDSSPIETALRETEEEVGLSQHLVEIVASLPTHKTATGFIINPYIGIISQPFKETLRCGEVDEVFTVPFDHILHEKNFSIQTRKWNGSQRKYYAVPYGPYYVWGATARILLNLSKALSR